MLIFWIEYSLEIKCLLQKKNDYSFYYTLFVFITFYKSSLMSIGSCTSSQLFDDDDDDDGDGDDNDNDDDDAGKSDTNLDM